VTQIAVPLCGAILASVFFTAALEKGISLTNVTNWLKSISVPLPRYVGPVTVLLELAGVALLMTAPIAGAIALAVVLLIGSPLLYVSSRAGVECGCFGKPKRLTRAVLFASFVRNGVLLVAVVILLIQGNSRSFDDRYRLVVASAVVAALTRVLLLRRAGLNRTLARGTTVMGNVVLRRRYVVGSRAPRWMVRPFDTTPGAEVGVVVDPAEVLHWRGVSERHVDAPVCVIPSSRKFLETPLAIALSPSGVIRGVGHVSDSYDLELFSRLARGV
jgi:uncharacterized membrane protein YphA (DoxX/SURF4 family)